MFSINFFLQVPRNWAKELIHKLVPTFGYNALWGGIGIYFAAVILEKKWIFDFFANSPEIGAFAIPSIGFIGIMVSVLGWMNTLKWSVSQYAVAPKPASYWQLFVFLCISFLSIVVSPVTPLMGFMSFIAFCVVVFSNV